MGAPLTLPPDFFTTKPKALQAVPPETLPADFAAFEEQRPGGVLGFGEEMLRTLTGSRNAGELLETGKRIGARLERAVRDPRGGGLFGLAADVIGSIVESEQARSAAAAEEPDFAKRVVKNIPFLGGRLGEAGEFFQRDEIARGLGATLGVPLLLAPRPTISAVARGTQAVAQAAPTAARIALKPAQVPFQALYQIVTDVRKRPAARLKLERGQAAKVERATRAIDQEMAAGFRRLETDITGPVTDTAKFRNILDESAAEVGLDPRTVPTPKTFARIEAEGGAVDFISARRSLREMYRDAHRSPDRQVRAASARASERIMEEVLQPAADALGPEMGGFYAGMRRSYAEYARDFLDKSSVGADLLDAIQQVKQGSTLPMIALFQDKVRGVQVRELMRKHQISTAPMDEILRSPLVTSRMPLTWDDATRLMSERGAKATRLQEITNIQERLGGGEAIRPGFTQYAAGVAQLIASLPLRVPGMRRFLLWGESDVVPTTGRTFRVPQAPPGGAAAPVPIVPPSAAAGAATPPEPTPLSKGAKLGPTQATPLQDQLALAQYGKEYSKLAPDERTLIDRLAADVERQP